MKIRNFMAPLLISGAAAAAVAFSPVALAAPSGPDCTSTGTASVCQSDGNAQVIATPPPVNYQTQYPFFGGLGLIFHHGGH